MSEIKNDWHKNGWLPPVGEVVILDEDGDHFVYILAHDFPRGHSKVAVFRPITFPRLMHYSGRVASCFRPIEPEDKQLTQDEINDLQRLERIKSNNYK